MANLPSASTGDGAAAAPEPLSPAVLRIADFRTFLIMRLCAVMALEMANVAVGWHIYEITRRALDLGLVGLAQFLPAIGLALVTGHVADRVDRRRVLIVCYAGEAAAIAGLLAIAAAGIAATWPIYALLLAIGVGRAFAMPAGQALAPNLVPVAALGRAVAWSSLVLRFALVAGPALGGALIAFGAVVSYAGAILLLLVAIAAVAAITPRPRPAAGRQPMSWATLSAGVAYVRSKPVLLGAMSLDLFAMLLGGATALLPVYARDILAIGAPGLGLLRAAPAVGAAVIALLLVRRPIRRRAGPIMFASVAAYGVATVAFGLSTDLTLSLICLVIGGMADMLSVFIRLTLVQLGTPDALRGRVSAVNSIFIGASNELGEFESGVTAAWLGAVRAVVLGGAGTLVVMGLWARWFPSLRRADRLS